MQIRIGRREMIGTLTGGTLIAMPFGLFLVSCGSSSSNDTSSADGPAAAPQKSGAQIVYTSSMVQSHSHTFGLDTSAIAMPPADGVSGATGNEGGHTHEVSISMEQLQNVGSGDSVKVTTSNVSGHTHVFTFVNVS
jgi:hypothetical protein